MKIKLTLAKSNSKPLKYFLNKRIFQMKDTKIFFPLILYLSFSILLSCNNRNDTENKIFTEKIDSLLKSNTILKNRVDSLKISNDSLSKRVATIATTNDKNNGCLLIQRHLKLLQLFKDYQSNTNIGSSKIREEFNQIAFLQKTLKKQLTSKQVQSLDEYTNSCYDMFQEIPYMKGGNSEMKFSLWCAISKAMINKKLKPFLCK